MASIRIISKGSVSGTTHSEPNQRIELTPWDLESLLDCYSQKGFLFHKPNPNLQERQWGNTLIHHLKTCLSRTLDFFPVLAGRLATVDHGDNSISFFIDCNNAGVDFVHAVADAVSVADILDPVYIPEIIDSFFQLNGVRNFDENTENPLLAVQVTELKDGIFIGCTTNHSVVDGTSIWHFFNSWSEISRAFDSISKPPILQRWFPCNIDYPIRISMPKKEQVFDSLFSLSPAVKQRIFHFPRENIAKLKAIATSEIGTNRISSLQSLMAHLWRSVVRVNQCLDPDQEVNCFIPVGVRARLQPPLPQEYFGNALHIGTVTMKARDIVEQGIGHVAWQMSKMIAMYTDEKVRNCLETWIRNPVVVSGRTNDANLMISNSPRFDVYGNDFGWGKPMAVRSGPSNKKIGKMSLFAGIEAGSVDIEARLSPEIMKAMESDKEFTEFITTP